MQTLVWREIHKTPHSFESYATLDSETLSQRVRLVLRACHKSWHLYVYNSATRLGTFPVALRAISPIDAQITAERTILRAGLSLASEEN